MLPTIDNLALVDLEPTHNPSNPNVKQVAVAFGVGQLDSMLAVIPLVPTRGSVIGFETVCSDGDCGEPFRVDEKARQCHAVKTHAGLAGVTNKLYII